MEEEERLLVQANMIRQFYFCEQIPYLNLCHHITEPETDSMTTSKTRHTDFHAQYLPRNIAATKIQTKVPIRSVKLGLEGVIDVIVQTKFGELIPCEFKMSARVKGRARKKDQLQLVAYAMLMEEEYGKTVKRGLIFYSEDKSKEEVPITLSDRKLVKTAVNRILEAVRNESPPKGRSLKNCPTCWYNHICRQ